MNCNYSPSNDEVQKIQKLKSKLSILSPSRRRRNKQSDLEYSPNSPIKFDKLENSFSQHDSPDSPFKKSTITFDLDKSKILNL